MAALAFVAMACSKEIEKIVNTVEETPAVNPVSVVFTAGVESKTAISGSNIEWQSGDQITLWNGSQKAAYSTTDSGASATFTTADTFAAANSYTALYPADADATFGASSVSTTLPAVQTATAGNFDPAANIGVAVSTTNTLSFYNAAAYLKFTVPAGMTDLASVSFKGNNSEKVAGACSVNTSTYALTATGSETATLSGTFAEGETYYLAVAPQAYSTGYTVTITRTSGTFEMVSSKDVTIARSSARNIGDLWDGVPVLVMSGSALDAPLEMTKVESDLTGTPKKVQFDDVYTFRGTLNTGKLNVSEKYNGITVKSDINIPAPGTYHVMYNKTTGRFKIYTQEMYVDLNRGNEHGASSAPWKMLRNNNPDTVDDSYPNYILTDYYGNDSGVRCDVSDFPATTDYKNAGTGGNDRNMPSYYADDEEWEKGVLYDGYCILLASTSANSEEKQLVISGLIPSSRYDFRIVSSRYNATPSARITRFTLVGASSVSHDINQGWKVSPEDTNSLLAFNFMASQKLDFDGVAPDAEGKVYIKIQGICAGTRADAHINGLRIAKVLLL